MNNDTSTIPPLPLHNQMPTADAGKRKVKKTEKARVLEENTDSDGCWRKQTHMSVGPRKERKRITCIDKIDRHRLAIDKDTGSCAHIHPCSVLSLFAHGPFSFV